jgi:hypothetical protein
MFYQKYVNSDAIGNYYISLNYYTAKFEDNEVKVIANQSYLEANVAYYITGNMENIENKTLYVKGSNGTYELIVDGTTVFYNPLSEARLYIDKECTEAYVPVVDKDNDGNFINNGISIYAIPNLLNGQIVSKIQVEFSEKNLEKLSNNAIFINADMIKGYKQTNETEINVYSFETIDDVTTKIRYLGIIPCNMQKDDFIILNYYTND